MTKTKEMLIYCHSGKNRYAKAKRDKSAGEPIWTAASRPQGKCQDGTRQFSFAYKSSIYMPDLAGRPWPARKR